MGTNLTSQVGTGRYTKQVSDMIKLPPYHYNVIVGLLLAEGWLNFGSSTYKNARLGLKQSIANFEYVWFVFNSLAHYCERLPLILVYGKVHLYLS